MWSEIKHSTLEPGMFYDNTIEFRIEGDLVIRINKIGLESLSGINTDFYAQIFVKEHHHAIEFLKDDDLDVIKLKCLVAAKELGWNIKTIFYQTQN